MKSRLEASISVLCSGTLRRKMREAIFSRSIVSFSRPDHSQMHSSFKSQEFQSSSEAVQQSDLEDGSFSELGPERAKSSTISIKLATEKFDPFLSNLSRRQPARRLLPSNIRPKIKDIVANIGHPSRASKVELSDPINASINDNERMSDNESPHSVIIKNITSKVSLSEIIDGASEFGKVSGASFVTASHGLKFCNVKFENENASRKAILAGEIIVGRQVFPVHHPNPAEVIAIRINNINKTTGDQVLHTICKSAGEFVGLARRSMDVVDVYFNASNQIIVSSILKKLNDTVVDQSRWSACLHTSKSMSSKVPADNCGEQLGRQVFIQLNELKKQLDLKKVHFQDLMDLHMGIMHAEDLHLDVEMSNYK